MSLNKTVITVNYTMRALVHKFNSATRSVEKTFTSSITLQFDATSHDLTTLMNANELISILNQKPSLMHCVQIVEDFKRKLSDYEITQADDGDIAENGWVVDKCIAFSCSSMKGSEV